MSIASDEWPRRHLIDVEQYYRMAEIGVLAPDARVELIEGEIIDTPPIGSNHAGVVTFLQRALHRGVADHLGIVSTQQPLRLGDRSEPQPDVMLLRPRADFYRNSHPTASDVLLLIEVSDSTLKFDRGPKTALYARHEIQEVWIIDLPHRQLHCMRNPTDGCYISIVSFSVPATITAAAVPELHIDLGSVFGD